MTWAARHSRGRGRGRARYGLALDSGTVRLITPIQIVLAEQNNTDTGTDYVTASGSPTANCYQDLIIMTGSSGGTTTPTGVSGCGLTWVAVDTAVVVGTGGTAKNLARYRALGTPTAGALTVAYGAVVRDSISLIWAEYGGVDTSGTSGSGAVVQELTDAQSGGGDPSVTLAAFEDASNLMVVASCDNVDTLSADADFTELRALHGTLPTRGLWLHYALDQVTYSATIAAGASAVWAIEIKSAG